METFLFLDTETTGFKKSGNLVQEGQARVVQLAMILTDENGNSLADFSTLVKPDETDWEIHQGAYEVHGKTKEMCVAHGIDQKEMINIFDSYISRASQIVAHNEAFDRGMMEIELAYYGDNFPELMPWYCTMKEISRRENSRWPKLNAALKKYCGRSMGSKAHDAMEDAKACKDIFFALRSNVYQNA